ncbi:MAG: inositol monophosphatase family protein [Desulfatiglandales bacterium]
MWEKEIAIARLAAEEAGRILEGMMGRLNRVTKKGEIDLVTEADLASEKKIIELITAHFPEDGILTEESGEYRSRSNRIWLVDPLDGTTNFAHNFPFFAVSIALEVREEIVLGVVFNPRMDEFFEAVKGGGAFLNHQAVKVSQTRGMRDSLLATGFPYDIHEKPEGVMARFRQMVVLAQGIRRPGAAALDLCYVAAGRFEGFWEEGLKPWDTAAGAIILSEAGGRSSNYSGEVFSPYMKSIVASNSYIHPAMLKALAGCDAD